MPPFTDQCLDAADMAIAHLEEENHKLKVILKKLMKFRWRDRGYDNVTCTSCGAQCSMDYENDCKVSGDKCSPNCPWRLAEEALDGK